MFAIANIDDNSPPQTGGKHNNNIKKCRIFLIFLSMHQLLAIADGTIQPISQNSNLTRIYVLS